MDGEMGSDVVLQIPGGKGRENGVRTQKKEEVQFWGSRTSTRLSHTDTWQQKGHKLLAS